MAGKHGQTACFVLGVQGWLWPELLEAAEADAAGETFYATDVGRGISSTMHALAKVVGQ